MKMTLGMILIVRDEIDLIERNLAFHLQRGIDEFAVMDNASTDGTRDILSSLSKRMPITIFDQPATDYRQDIWATELARYLKERGIDWAISLDADEFLCNEKSNLKDVVAAQEFPTILERKNVLPLEVEQSTVFENPLSARYCVTNPLSTQLPIMFRKMPGKILFPLRGLRSVARGNHQIEHETQQRTTTNEAMIRHFPVPSFPRFLLKLNHAGERFRQEQNVSTDTSWHIRRWLEILSEGDIEEEYRSFFIPRAKLEQYLADKTIEPDLFAETIERHSYSQVRGH